MSFSTGAQHSGMQMFMFPPLAGVLRVRAYMHACVRTCMRAYVHACERACMRVCVRACPHSHMTTGFCAFPCLCVFQEFERKSDSWRILDALSEGCGSPQYDEEIIV